MKTIKFNPLSSECLLRGDVKPSDANSFGKKAMLKKAGKRTLGGPSDTTGKTFKTTQK